MVYSNLIVLLSEWLLSDSSFWPQIKIQWLLSDNNISTTCLYSHSTVSLTTFLNSHGIVSYMFYSNLIVLLSEWLLSDSSLLPQIKIQWLLSDSNISTTCLYSHSTVSLSTFMNSHGIAQPIPLGVSFSKAQSSKLERLFCHVLMKRDVRALSFELSKQYSKMLPQVGLAVSWMFYSNLIVLLFGWLMSDSSL